MKGWLSNNSITYECQCKCNDDAVMQLTTSDIDNVINVNYILKFILLTVILLISSISRSTIVSLGDAICFQMLLG